MRHHLGFGQIGFLELDHHLGDFLKARQGLGRFFGGVQRGLSGQGLSQAEVFYPLLGSQRFPQQFREMFLAHKST
jgi:hypothetical protein